MGIRVLLINNAVHPLMFKPIWHWRTHLRGVSIVSINVPSGKTLPYPGDFTHIILTGSEASILEPKPWFSAEADLVRQAVAQEIPILGSCFGHQMLVYALSGSEFLRAADPPEVGWAKIEMTGEDELLRGLPNPWSTFVYHFDEVHDPPAPWIKLGRSAHCDTHVLRYGALPVWGIQAHPEISSFKARLFIQVAALSGRKPLRHGWHALRHVPPRDAVVAPILDNFFSWKAPRRGRPDCPSDRRAA